MDEFPIDEGFVMTFPCYAIMSENARGAVIQNVRCMDGSFGPALLFFTDDDLLHRYRRQFPELHGPTIRFDFAEVLALYLKAISGSFSHVIWFIRMNWAEQLSAQGVEFPLLKLRQTGPPLFVLAIGPVHMGVRPTRWRGRTGLHVTSFER